MELTRGKVAVVTGAGSGIGLALARRFAQEGLHVVLSDIDEAGLAAAADTISGLGVEVLAVRTDVSRVADVEALAAASIDRFGAVHVVCNNAGVASRADQWFGPLSTWEWVIGVNFWGVVHGVRAFLPQLLGQGEGHIVNTASIAGLRPGFGGSYDASKHAVVAVTEDLYNGMQMLGLPIGVSVVCPGWVSTSIFDADRNWPAELGDKPPPDPTAAILEPHMRRAIAEGSHPEVVADAVVDAIRSGRYWVFPQPEFLDIVGDRFHAILDRRNPEPVDDVPGLPSAAALREQIQAAFGLTGG